MDVTPATKVIPDIVLESVLTCLECGYSKTEHMPTDACQWFYECDQCHAVLKPKPGDCCVYCSYTDIVVGYKPTIYGRSEASITRALAPFSIR